MKNEMEIAKLIKEREIAISILEELNDVEVKQLEEINSRFMMNVKLEDEIMIEVLSFIGRLQFHEKRYFVATANTQIISNDLSELNKELKKISSWLVIDGEEYERYLIKHTEILSYYEYNKQKQGGNL